jgi:hypothetical protein
MRRDFRRQYIGAEHLDRGESTIFILAEKLAIADYVGGDNRREFATHTHLLFINKRTNFGRGDGPVRSAMDLFQASSIRDFPIMGIAHSVWASIKNTIELK